MEGFSSPESKQVSVAERFAEERSHAMQGVLEYVRGGLHNTFETTGTPHDLLVQEAERLQELARNRLEKAIVEGDYRKEQASAKFEAFVEVYTELVKRFAELKSAYPEHSKLFSEIAPALSGLEKRGETLMTLH